MSEEKIRLQKYLSQAEVCSRRKAEEMISDGMVRVNGKVAILGQCVTPGEDVVKIGSKTIAAGTREHVIMMMNKPRGYVCTNLDPHNAQTVFQLVPAEYAQHKLFCVGRLDKDSEGMLLITNDGDLANKIIHPSSDIIKRYEVTLNRDYDPALTPRLLKGVKDEDEFLRFTNIIRFPDGKKLEIHLNQGRKREIRRLFEIFGFFVKKLVRFQIGGLVLKKMPPGDCRVLSNKEIESIFSKHGNADPRHTSLVKKINRAALRGEKAKEPSRGFKLERKRFEAAQERQAVIEKKVQEKRDMRRAVRAARFSEEEELGISHSRGHSTARSNNKPRGSNSRDSGTVWSKENLPHHKGTRTRGYVSRKKQ